MTLLAEREPPGKFLTWSGAPPSEGRRRAMEHALVDLCEAVAWPCSVQDPGATVCARTLVPREPGKRSKVLAVPVRRHGVVIFPPSPLGRREVSFAFASGPGVPDLPTLSTLVRGREGPELRLCGGRIGPPSELDALAVLLLLVKRLWMPGLVVEFEGAGLGGRPLEWAEANRLFLEPESRVLEYLHSPRFRDWLEASPAGREGAGAPPLVCPTGCGASVPVLEPLEEDHARAFAREVARADPRDLGELHGAVADCKDGPAPLGAIWPDGYLFGEAGGRRVRYLGLGSVLPHLPRFRRLFEVDVRPLSSTLGDFAETCCFEPAEEWTDREPAPLPDPAREFVIEVLLDAFTVCPPGPDVFSRHGVSGWLRKSCERLQADGTYPWRPATGLKGLPYWRGLLVLPFHQPRFGTWHELGCVSWAIVPELRRFLTEPGGIRWRARVGHLLDPMVWHLPRAAWSLLRGTGIKGLYGLRTASADRIDEALERLGKDWLSEGQKAAVAEVAGPTLGRGAVPDLSRDPRVALFEAAEDPWWPLAVRMAATEASCSTCGHVTERGCGPRCRPVARDTDYCLDYEPGTANRTVRRAVGPLYRRVAGGGAGYVRVAEEG